MFPVCDAPAAFTQRALLLRAMKSLRPRISIFTHTQLGKRLFYSALRPGGSFTYYTKRFTTCSDIDPKRRKDALGRVTCERRKAGKDGAANPEIRRYRPGAVAAFLCSSLCLYTRIREPNVMLRSLQIYIYIYTHTTYLTTCCGHYIKQAQ